MVRLHRKPNIHDTLQNAVVAAINDPSYSFSLPRLSDWESIISSSVNEKQRLEFVGDAVMHLSVALYLYRLFPDAAPGLYTHIRSAVNTNATFTHLMVKAGAYKLPSHSHSTKAVADSFEVIVAALYVERGFADVYAWVQEQYAPLIAAARESYDKCLSTSARSIPFFPAKRHRGPLDPAGTPLLKKIRLSSGRTSPRSTLMAQRVINRMKSKGKVKLYLPTKNPNPPLEMRLHSRELRTPEPRRLVSPLLIDLTVDSDSDGGEVTSSTTAQESQPNTKPLALSTNQLRLSHSAPESNQTACRWLPNQSSTASQALSYRTPGSPSSSASSATAMSSDDITSIPQATFTFFSRTGLSIPPQLDNIYTPFGTYGNPILIEDSDTES